MTKSAVLERSVDLPDIVGSVGLLRKNQADTYELLEQEVARIERDPANATRARLLRIDHLGADLNRMCRELESALELESKRLRDEGTSDDLDLRWIKNLRRLEFMRALLNRALAVIPEVRVA